MVSEGLLADLYPVAGFANLPAFDDRIAPLNPGWSSLADGNLRTAAGSVVAPAVEGATDFLTPE